jgi:hypothetical protein
MYDDDTLIADQRPFGIAQRASTTLSLLRSFRILLFVETPVVRHGASRTQ